MLKRALSRLMMTFMIKKEPVSRGVVGVTMANSLKKQYYCEKCKSAFSKQCYLRLHMKSHSFRCSLCSQRYFHKSLLRRHVETEHTCTKVKEGEEKFECEKCPKIFLTKREYNCHQLADHLYKYRCLMIDCRMVFKTKKEYDDHKKKFHPDKFHCPENDCRRVFKTKEECEYHQNKPHRHKFQWMKTGDESVLITKEYDHKTKSSLQKCEICGKKVTKDLNRHLLIHTPKDIRCKICRKSFHYREDLRKHLLIHLKVKQFTCNYCEKSFTQKGNLTSHIRIHSGEKPFKCKICQSSFVRKDHLSMHEKAIHGGKEARKFSCDKCQFTALTENKVKRHKNRCHKEAKCEVCSAVLKCPQTLERHSWTHRDDKPFSCQYCSLKYATKHNFTRHVKRVHERESDTFCEKAKHFSCAHCSRKYAVKSELTKHLKRVHL